MRFEWNRPLGVPGNPYLRRWMLPLPFGWSLRLHHWLSDDDHEAIHDHPTWFWTLVLRGGYTDFHPNPDDDGTGWLMLYEQLKGGDLRFRPADHRHAVVEVLPQTWTLCLFGREHRKWFFWHRGKQYARDRYFLKVGHHTPDGGRYRKKYDGTPVG